MTIQRSNSSEQDRLDLRQALETVLGGKRLAAIAMEAMPPINYENFATKDDLAAGLGLMRARFDGLETRFDALESSVSARFDAMESSVGARLDASSVGFDGKLERLNGELQQKMAAQLRTIVAMQIATILALASIITATA